MFWTSEKAEKKMHGRKICAKEMRELQKGVTLKNDRSLADPGGGGGNPAMPPSKPRKLSPLKPAAGSAGATVRKQMGKYQAEVRHLSHA